MMSRVLRVAPIITRTVPRRTLHASAVRADLIQDLYTTEIKSFKPKQLSEKDAEGVVVKWTTPTAPKAPGEEVSINEIDSYSSSPVEVESAPVATENAETTPDSNDWFPIEYYDKLDGEH